MSSSYQYFNVSDTSDSEKLSKKKFKSQNATCVNSQGQKDNATSNQKNGDEQKQVKAKLQSDQQTNGENNSSNQVQKSPSDSVSTNVEDNQNVELPQKVQFKIHLSGFNTVLTPEELKNLQFEDSRHYKVLGESRMFYTRGGNLSQKIKEIHNHKEEQERQALLQEKRRQQELQKNQSSENAINKEQSDKTEEGENYKDLFEFDKNNRYFQQDQKQQMTCRRCKQPGHFERMCMIEIKNVCYYCLSDHLSHECKQRICFNCNQLGHVGRNCPNQGAQRCPRCQKMGHVKADCGAIMFSSQMSRMRENNNRFYGIEEEWKKTDDQKVKCQICKRKGHLNCKKDYPQNTRDEVYGQKFQDRMKKLRRKEEVSKFQGKIINFHYIDDFEESSSSTCNSHSSVSPSQERRNKKEKENQKKQAKLEQRIQDNQKNEDIQIHILNEKRKEYKKDFKTKPVKELIPPPIIPVIEEVKEEKVEKKDKKDKKKEKKQKRKQHAKQEESDIDDGRFENLYAMNMMEEKNLHPYGSDVYISDINEDDYDYGNDEELDYETKRANRIRDKRREEDRNRERSKQKSRIYEQKQNKSNDRNIFNKSKSDRYFDQDYNKDDDHYRHHHRSRSEGRNKNSHSHSHSKNKYDRESDHSVFVDRTKNHKHKHVHHHHDEHYYDYNHHQKSKSFSNNVFDDRQQYNNNSKKQKRSK